ncbi:MAG: cation diffusion facilitator family transporter [Clostridiales bacterium]|jgi:cation diffusion facilitator family transporter|nr:cation diffusion facilitator family transporter [Clostridiales bacterium]
MQDKNIQKAIKVSVVSIAVNAALTAFKFMAGIFAGSLAMLSDAAHTASDVVSTLIVIMGVRISGKKSDANHQYGHERFECIAAIILSVLLFVTGAGIGYSAIFGLIKSYSDFTVPGNLALAAAVVSIVVKEALYHYTMHTAKAVNSGALRADAWHHRSDALSSVGSFIGILGAILGFVQLDAIAGAVICLLIIKTAVKIFVDSVKKITDEACGEDFENKLRENILVNEKVIIIDSLKTRRFGERVYADIEISVDADMRFVEAHDVATAVHDNLESNFPMIKHCTVHVNPFITSD